MPESKIEFLDLTFDGGRFATHSAPVDVLAEFATVQQVILKVARQLFFAANPDRHRVPNGFVEAAQLHLFATEPNCFTAQLGRPAQKTSAPEEAALFDAARDLSLNALAAIAAGREPPADFPVAELEALAGLGRRLEGDEALIMRGGENATARVDQKSRERMAALIKRPLERVESVDGEVEQLDDAGDRCVLRTRAGERVELPFDITQRAWIVEAVRLRPIARVRVRGQMVFQRPIRKMKTTEEMELIDDNRAPEVQKIWDRLDAFDQIDEGWLEGKGRPPSLRAVSVARGVLARLLVEQPDLQRPSVFPTPSGGVQAEWVFGVWAADIMFDADDDGIEAEATNGDTGEERSATFDGSHVSSDSVAPLAEWLEALAKMPTVERSSPRV